MSDEMTDGLLPGVTALPDDDTRAIYRREVNDLAAKLLEEAGRLAAARSTGTVADRIGPSDINRAARYIRDRGVPPPHPPRPTRTARICQVASYACAIISGYFINNITQAWGAIGFAIVVLLGAAFVALGSRKQ